MLLLSLLIAAQTPVVEVKANAELQRRADTTSKTIVTRDEILKYGDQSLLEVMKRLPGVTIVDNAVRMRGLGSGYTQVLLNGERAPAGFALDSISPELIEKIEVQRSASADQSTQAIAGSINIVLRKTVQKAAGEVKFSGGSGPAAHALGGTLAKSDKIGPWSYQLTANVNRNEFHSASSWIEQAQSRTATVSDNQNRGNFANLSARLTWADSAADSVSWQNYAAASHFIGESEGRTQLLAGPAYPYPWMLGFYHVDGTVAKSDLNWLHKFAEGAKLDVKLGLNQADRDRALLRVATQFERVSSNQAHDRGMSLAGKLTVPAGDAHGLAFGWDGARSLFDEIEIQRDMLVSVRNDYAAQVSRLALFAQDEWDISKAWSVYAGLRWEGIDTHSAYVANRSSVWSPLLNTRYKFAGPDADQVRLALTRTYRAPDVSRLIPRHFYGSVNSAISPDFGGNAALKPELALGLDASYEHYWPGGGLLSVSLSARDIQGAVRNTVEFENGRWVSRPRNQGKAHVRGLEFEYKRGPVRASVSRNWSHVEGVPGPGNRLDGQMPWTANLGIDGKQGDWAGGAAFNYAAGGWTRSTLEASSLAAPLRDLDAYLLYQGKLRISLRNLLKTSNETGSRYLDQSTITQTASFASLRVQYEHKF